MLEASQAFLRVAEHGARLASRYHRARLLGQHHLPKGPALLVGNHGVFGYETPVFFYLLLRASGRYPLGLADHGFFKLPLFKTVLPWLGGIDGTRENARRALDEGHLVVCYPGGASEVFKRPRARYRLRWERAIGFAKVAAEAGVPVIPFAGAGVDDTFALSDDDRLTVPLSAADPRYRAPVGVPLPLPVRLSFALGKPLPPPAVDAPDHEFLHFKERVAHAVQHLLRRASDA